MNKTEAAKKIKGISKALEDHNYRYYVLDRPTVSDKEYDELLKTLIDLEEQFPDAHFQLTTSGQGTVTGNSTSYQYDTLTVNTNDFTWSFWKNLTDVTPVALANWDVVGFTSYDESNANHTYAALDHYNFDYMEEILTLVCALLNLEIPGYPLIAVGIIAIITVSVIIRKKFKK